MNPLDVPPPARAFRCLATAYYRPGSDVVYSSTTTADADVDATNAAVTFVVPASGIVWVTAKFMTAVGINSPMDVTLREGSATLAGTTTRAVYAGGGSASIQNRVCIEWKFTGLTPGSSHTYKLGFARQSGTDSCTIHAGTFGGPLSMTAEERP